MINFKNYLIESFERNLFESLAADTEKVKHLSHVEDLGHIYGHEGTAHAISALHAAANHINHGLHNSSLTTKVDGGISIIAGKHPVTGQQCVAYKSGLDKIGTEHEHKAKICFSHDDIDRHYSDKPYVATPLHHALDHAHKTLPKHGLHQGDVLFTDKTKHDDGNKISFTPNTIKYSAKKSSAEGQKISKARFGVAWHTSYDSHNGVIKSRPINHNELSTHDDAYNLSTANDTSRAHFSESDKAKFHNHLAAATAIHNEGGHAMHDAVHKLSDHVGTYINQTVRTGETPSSEGLKTHLSDKGKKEFDAVKTEKAKKAKINKTKDLRKHVDDNSNHFDNYFKMHHHLQSAKNILVKTLDNADHPLEHHIDNKKTHPEGYVLNHGGSPIKLVNRGEFSKANFAKTRD